MAEPARSVREPVGLTVTEVRFREQTWHPSGQKMCGGLTTLSRNPDHVDYLEETEYFVIAGVGDRELHYPLSIVLCVRV